ncbi:hypothetical protein BGZ54_010322, partial [Gamsiella multidivaricata]
TFRDYKILIVVDEAQGLSNWVFGTYSGHASPEYAPKRTAFSAQEDYRRPVLSPFIHGLYQTASDRGHICVILCETGLSVIDMEWLDSAGSILKDYMDQLRPFTDFIGWESLEQVRDYRGLVRSALPSQEARIVFDAQVPEASIQELFDGFRGRFRPIVSTIERMIMLKPGISGIDWKSAIKETKDTLTSTELHYYYKGNIAYDISRMVKRVHKFESRYAEYQNIRSILQLFVLEHYLHGRPVLINKEEAPLIEASVGRILHFGEETATVLDEPFALRAAVNYFCKENPDFHSAICTLFRSAPNASVYGYTWEMAVQPSLVDVFHDKVLSKTALVAKLKSYDDLLDHTAKIVGNDDVLTLGIDYRSMSLEEFLAANVENGPLKDGKPVPPFYHPAEIPSGPDIVFVLHFDNHGYCPVFIQLKMRTSMNKPQTQSAFTMVKADAPAELRGVEDLFPSGRQSERIRAAQGEQPPECILLGIDKNNIHSLFPKRHMDALDRLSGIKRELNRDSDDLADQRAAKQRRYEDDESHMDCY